VNTVILRQGWNTSFISGRGSQPMNESNEARLIASLAERVGAPALTEIACKRSRALLRVGYTNLLFFRQMNHHKKNQFYEYLSGH
jgi:hypothetical protein